MRDNDFPAAIEYKFRCKIESFISRGGDIDLVATVNKTSRAGGEREESSPRPRNCLPEPNEDPLEPAEEVPQMPLLPGGMCQGKQMECVFRRRTTTVRACETRQRPLRTGGDLSQRSP